MGVPIAKSLPAEAVAAEPVGLAGETLAVFTAPSSLRIVPVALNFSIVVPGEAFQMRTQNVSSGSAVVSPLTDTVMLPVVSPAGIVNVPLVAV